MSEPANGPEPADGNICATSRIERVRTVAAIVAAARTDDQGVVAGVLCHDAVVSRRSR